MATNLHRLNAAILANEQLEKSFTEYKEKSEMCIQVLYNENKMLKAEVAYLKSAGNDVSERLSRLESRIGIVYVDGDVELDVEVNREGTSGGTTEQGHDGAPGVEEKGESEAATATDVALKSKTFRDLMLESFRKLMGIPKLDGPSLPGYPMGIGEGSDAWPMDRSTGKKLIRFDWRAGKQDEPVNIDGLAKVVSHMQAAAEHDLATKRVIEKIPQKQLEKAVRTKYMRMATEYRKTDKKRKRTEEDDEFADEEVEVVETSLSRAQMNSRVQSKLDARKRKRASDECSPEWKDKKYDTAFILNAMSDDDDNPDHIPGEPLSFLTMEPEWRHPHVSEMFSVIDALKDPRPDQAGLAKTRLRSAEKKKGPPPVARTLATRVRTWMVRPELLQENPEWFTTGRVVCSGAVWGEDKPKELPKDKKGKGKMIEAGPSAKKVIIQKRKTDDEGGSLKTVLEVAQKKIDELLEGRQAVDELFE